MNADDIIAHLDLAPHPEGGHYRQTWVAQSPKGARPHGTAIHFLLKAGERSHWHKVDAEEIWLFHTGAPLTLSIAKDDAGPACHHDLGPDLAKGHAPQLVVPLGHWQAAQSQGAFTLVSCIVCPGFDFDGFTLAPEGFDIA